MIFNETDLKGGYIIDIEMRQDDRGFFARSWCHKEFEAHGLKSTVVQYNISFNRKSGTLRGMHYQRAPYEEAKLVRCTQGAIYDVMIDLRPKSPTFAQWLGVELTAANHRMVYVPEGFAHGFQTLLDGTEVTYHVTEFYTPDAEAGLRYNDPVFAIRWPIEVRVISEKDRSWPDFKLAETDRVYRAAGLSGVAHDHR
jgi:dTDP-4-dehydrorhamnose 3,5-epimerase